MAQSMTAFSRVVKRFPEGALVWELRSVNHRYLDVSVRLPEPFRALEMEFRQTVRDNLERGKVDLTLSLDLSANTSTGSALQLDKNLAKQVLEFARQLSGETGLANNLTLEVLLKWPGVIAPQAPNEKDLIDLAKVSLKEALNELCRSRLREGEKLIVQIRQRLEQISALILKARETSLNAASQMRSTLLSRLNELKQEAQREIKLDISDARLEQELLFYLHKMDVNEELDRLTIHVEEAHRLLIQSGGMGRKFDFLLQEFNREANTLGSKSSEVTLSKIAVELKVLIEQIREQIQNIE